MAILDDRKLIEELHRAISESDFSCDYRCKLSTALDDLFKRFTYYEEVALHGRDSKDAKGLRKCHNDPLDFIRLDLEA